MNSKRVRGKEHASQFLHFQNIFFEIQEVTASYRENIYINWRILLVTDISRCSFREFAKWKYELWYEDLNILFIKIKTFCCDVQSHLVLQ